MKNLVLLLTAVFFIIGTTVAALAAWQAPVQVTSTKRLWGSKS
jgi:hypothetical protein